MNAKIIDYFHDPSEDRLYDLLYIEGEEIVVMVDWRTENDEIVDDFESRLQTGTLSCHTIESDNDHGFDVVINYKGQQKQVPIETLGTHNRQEVIVILNELLLPDYEIRFCIDSMGNDTLAFLPLACQEWKDIESQFGQDNVRKRFYPINANSPNMFTDRVYPATFEDGELVIHQKCSSQNLSSLIQIIPNFIRSIFHL